MGEYHPEDRGSCADRRTGRKWQVLVVDDDQVFRELLSKTLAFWGYQVTQAADGHEAWTLFLTNPYDLVITDIKMPLMNGWELSRLIKERSPSTPVIVVSGCGDDTNLEKTNMRCVDASMVKPFKLKEIEGTVRRLLNSGI
jgi:two-component system autoinducer 1 sensor kinase/phosphatase LuxN